jgi:PadR family transcriptional regulator, regulatory protein PadR
MSKGELLGEFEHLTLLAVLRLDRDSYGMRVRQEIAERTGRDVSIGAVYATLDRLAAKGLVIASMGEATAERGGRAKRCFRLTRAGVDSVNRARHEMESMIEGLRFPLRGAR